jgi:hypothetical protein
MGFSMLSGDSKIYFELSVNHAWGRAVGLFSPAAALVVQEQQKSRTLASKRENNMFLFLQPKKHP